MAWHHTAMRLSLAYASTLTLLFFLNVLNKQIAYTKPRTVDLGEEVIVITGGARGLGLLIAEVYGMRGATVAVLDIEELEAGEARGVTAYKCDVGDSTQVARVAAQIEKELGAPTILINNAGVVNGKSLLDLPIEDIKNSINVNLLAHFYTIKAFLPGMLREGRGTIVTVSSVIGKSGAAQLTDYAAAKAGLSAMHVSLAAELRQYPEIKTILVTPGQLSTPLFAGVQTPSSFLAPIIEPVEVAKEIIASIDGGSSADLTMPLYARWIDWMNVLPVGVQRIARWASGIDVAMKTFVGRKGNSTSEKEIRS